MRQILVDGETGVNYLVWKSGYAGGITPFLDSEGIVVIRKPKARDEVDLDDVQKDYIGPMSEMVIESEK